MAYDIGPKIGIEGETEFRKAIRDINNNMRTLGTEMKVVTSEFDKNDNSMEAVNAKNKVLNKQIDKQKEKLSELAEGLDQSSKKYGENNRVTEGWQQSVNKATADLNKMERELKNNTKSLDGFGDEIDDANSKGGKFSGILGNMKNNLKKVGGSAAKAAVVGLKSVGVAMGAVTLAAGAMAIKLGKEVVKQFGELEQNLGGSEAVFGEYAKSIQKSGEDAYKNLGVSQSDYLATANKMGALFQGSGLEQQKSLELTEKSMQRAADMASVMGIDMQVALDAVTGAAKGNFTMMDNLGVSMNATSIQAYATGKGLDFVWASASQAEKSEVAMQMFFENTEQYAGNFAKESTETISGSIGLMQAALGSFTAGLGNTDADMKNLTGNLVDAFKIMVKNIVPVIENLVDALPDAIDGILDAVVDLLPMLVSTVSGLFNQVLKALLNLLPDLIPVAVEAIMSIVMTLIDNLPLLIDAGLQIIVALVGALTMALPQLTEMAPQIIDTITIALSENLPLIISMGLQIIVALVGALIANIPKILESVDTIVLSILEGLLSGIGEILSFVPELFNNMVDAFNDINWSDLGKNIIKGIGSGVADSAKGLADSVGNAASGALGWTKKKLGIESPSKVFKNEVGKMMGLGIAEGIKDSAKQVESAMSGLNRKLNVDVGTNVNMNGGLAALSKVMHSGTITIKGVNDNNQFMGAVDLIMDELRKEVRAR